MVKAKPLTLYHREGDPVSILEENGWAPGPVWGGGAENLAASRIRYPGRPLQICWEYFLNKTQLETSMHAVKILRNFLINKVVFVTLSKIVLQGVSCLGNSALKTINSLTPWSRVLLEKITGSLLVKNFPAFYGTRRFSTAFSSYPGSDQPSACPQSNFLKIHFNLRLGLPSGHFPPVVPTHLTILCTCHIHAHLVLLI